MITNKGLKYCPPCLRRNLKKYENRHTALQNTTQIKINDCACATCYNADLGVSFSYEKNMAKDDFLVENSAKLLYI